MFSDEPIRVFQGAAPHSGLALQRNSARRQFDFSIAILALTLALGIATGLSQIASHGFTAVPGGYGVDEAFATAAPLKG